MALPSRSSSFSYDVFLSFRGSDTRLGFTGNLYKALCDRGIYTFIDDEELQRGEEITPALLKAIQESRIAITVLSEDYASSSFCLEELATILHCAQNKGMLVIPVFYMVDPSDVRHHKGSYGKALAKHEKRFKAKKEKLQKWKMALHQVANFSGYHFKHGYGYEYKFIGSIVEQVSREINRAPLHVAEYPVGLGSQLLEVKEESKMALPSRSSSFSYDVYLNFRGEDTRLGFTGNLYKALCDKGIHTFIDDQELQSGEEITSSLEKAIEESRIAITVLSKNYASSSFCLDELATILDDCAETERKGKLVLPVFYDLDPSHVRHQKGSYGEAFAKHEKRFKAKKEKVQKWKMALHQLADLSGFHFKHGDDYEHKFIEKIVEWVSDKIQPALLYVADYPVGLESQVLKVRKLLDVGSDDGVHMIGIHGMGGLGKSALARAIYNDLAYTDFDDICFLENVREESNKHGLKHLQSILLSKILGGKGINLTSWKEGPSVIQRRLKRKKVLLILDDVDKLEQLQAIVGRPDWFGPGSRVIITTRDKQLLASHGIESTYEVEGLSKNDSLQLLTWKAFRTEEVDPSYVEVLKHVVTYASGNPLALEVIGSNLYGKSIEEWKSYINLYERIPSNQILEILKVSFDALEEKEKSVFLDIACCFKGYELAEVEVILRAHYGHSMKYLIGVLNDKSLIKLSNDIVTLHDLIGDMGKEIVRQESRKEPGKRSRLWLREDIIQVLEDNMGTSKIEMMCLDLPIFDEEEVVEWNSKAFKEMVNLKTLIIRNGNFSKGPKYLPENLRVLEWWRYPSHSLPSNFDPKKLAICKLPAGCISTLELAGSEKKFVNLTVLNLDKCKCLTQIPNMSSLPNLEELSFEHCQNLITVHNSIGFLDKLKILSAFGCTKLRSFPPLKLTSLEELHLSCCYSLKSFPEILGKMQNIKELHLQYTPIKELPFSFQNFNQLQILQLTSCGIVQLPSGIVMMPELIDIIAHEWKGWQWLKQEDGEGSSKVESFCASGCNLYDDFFSIGFTRFAHVSKLDLSGNNFTILPECIKECQVLRELDVSNCKHLREITGTPPNLKHFFARYCKSMTSLSISMFLNQELHEAGNTLFHLPGVSIPEWFDNQSREPSSSFWFHNKFPDKVLCLVIAPMDNECGFFRPMVFINGSKCSLDCVRFLMRSDHTYLFDLREIEFENNVDGMPFENEWNHVEVTCAGLNCEQTSILKEIGIHVFEQESSLEDIQFTDPSIIAREN